MEQEHREGGGREGEGVSYLGVRLSGLLRDGSDLILLTCHPIDLHVHQLTDRLHTERIKVLAGGHTHTHGRTHMRNRAHTRRQRDASTHMHTHARAHTSVQICINY